MFGTAGFTAFAEGKLEAGRDLFGLGKIGLGAGGQAATGDGGKALVGGHAFALIQHHGEIPLADLAERVGVMVQPVRVIAGIGAHAGGFAFGGRAVVVGRDQPGRALAAHLQRQLPAQLDGLADHRGQKRGFGDQRLDHRGVGVLFQHLIQHPVQPRDATADARGVQLEWQDGIVPGDLRTDGHGVS